MGAQMIEVGEISQRGQAFREVARPEGALAVALSRLSGTGQLRLRRGRTLIAEGEALSFGFLLMSGMAMEAVMLPDGRRHVLDLLEPGDLCGVDREQPSRRTVQAATDLRLLRFPIGGFRRLLSEQQGLAAAAAEIATRRYARAERKLVAIGCLNAEQRTAQLLLWLAERADNCGAGGRGTVLLPLNRVDMGDYLGVSGETVCRALSRLKALGLVHMPNPHRFSLPNRRSVAEFICAGGPPEHRPARSHAA